jgi:membrane-associated HD superfamily phosphohydrolase
MGNGPDGEKDQRQREEGRPDRERDRPERNSGRDETEEERLDRNLGELLQELRVALPGVQVLFAFLLAVPFQQNFTKITGFQKGAYFGTLICTAISAVMLISPTAYHRLTFRYQQKRRLVYYSNQFSIIGLTFLALAMTGAIMLITDVLFGGTATALMTAATVLVFGVFWFGLPLRRRLSLSAAEEPLEMPADD